MTLQSAENHLLSSLRMRGTMGGETSRYRWIPAFAGMTGSNAGMTGSNVGMTDSSNLTANPMTTGI